MGLRQIRKALPDKDFGPRILNGFRGKLAVHQVVNELPHRFHASPGDSYDFGNFLDGNHVRIPGTAARPGLGGERARATLSGFNVCARAWKHLKSLLIQCHARERFDTIRIFVHQSAQSRAMNDNEKPTSTSKAQRGKDFEGSRFFVEHRIGCCSSLLARAPQKYCVSTVIPGLRASNAFCTALQ